ncbi:MAG TPA: sortase [Acidimicrobiales bacterium]|nr:sortase [Acidimicrobiales bacterium]
MAERPAGVRPWTPHRIATAVGVWLALTLVAVPLVLYAVGPLLQKRDQRRLLDEIRVEIRRAAGAEDSFSEREVVTVAPGRGHPVAIVDIPDLRLQQVVVEGAGPQETRRGPGHVPGTAGLGQPGNSAVVARRSAFGGSFGALADLARGDEILVTTTQGASVYEVEQVRDVTLVGGKGTIPATTTTAPTTTTTDGDPAAPAPAALAAPASTAATARPAAGSGGRVSTDELYGPTPDDRLTLVTSDSRWPLATDRATVVVAGLTELPFEPTPQAGRSLGEDGRGRDPGAWLPLALAVAAYGATSAAAAWVYRHGRARSAYLLTAPPLLAATFLMAETVARVLPAWA